MSDHGPKDEAIRRAAESTQPEVALVIDGYCIVKSATLAQHEYNLGNLIQLRHEHAALLEERRVLREAATEYRDAEWANRIAHDECRDKCGSFEKHNALVERWRTADANLCVLIGAKSPFPERAALQERTEATR